MKNKYVVLSLMLIGLVLFGCSSKENNNTVEASEIKMRVQDGYIQYYTGSSWENLLSTEELKGEKGDKGDKGDPGVNGKNGINGLNGVNGTDGKDGVNGKDTITQNNITKQCHISIYDKGPNPGESTNYGGIAIINKENVEIIVEKYLNNDNSRYENFYILLNENGKIEIEAKPEENWKFVEWSDGVTDTRRTITYDCMSDLEAYFEPSKTALNIPRVTVSGTNYGTKDYVIDWKGDENAKDYTVIFNNKTYTCNTNSLTVDKNELDESRGYIVSIVANPKDEDNYMSSSYSIETNEASVITKIVPEYVAGVTTIEQYKTALTNAGFIYEAVNENDKITAEIEETKEGATAENKGTIKNVTPEQKTRVYNKNCITIYVYKTSEE